MSTFGEESEESNDWVFMLDVSRNMLQCKTHACMWYINRRPWPPLRSRPEGGPEGSKNKSVPWPNLLFSLCSSLCDPLRRPFPPVDDDDRRQRPRVRTRHSRLRAPSSLDRAIRARSLHITSALAAEACAAARR